MNLRMIGPSLLCRSNACASETGWAWDAMPTETTLAPANVEAFRFRRLVVEEHFQPHGAGVYVAHRHLSESMEPTRYFAMVWQGGLGMPYREGDTYDRPRKAYREYIVRVAE